MIARAAMGETFIVMNIPKNNKRSQEAICLSLPE
jgi:hypothetical protein